jgi:hypothetical protein
MVGDRIILQDPTYRFTKAEDSARHEAAVEHWQAIADDHRLRRASYDEKVQPRST